MGATASLRRPQTGATAELPVPQTGEVITPEVADAESFQSTAGEFRKGLRSGVNSIGAGALQLAGSIGESLGLSEFAARRFAEAEDYVAFSEAVGPSTRDYRAVRDLTDAVNFAAGLSGQAAGTMLPALAGGAAGARLGLRGAVAGAYGGSLVPNAGEQALRVKGEGTPNERLANALGTGAVAAGMDVIVPAAGFRKIAQAARTGARAAPVGRTIAQATGAEAATEAGQEALGQAAHTLIAPGRDKADDTAQIINSALGGAIGGAGFGAGTSGLSSLAGAYRRSVQAPSRISLDPTRAQTPDEVRDALGTLERPADPDDLSGAPDDLDQVPAYLDEKDASDQRGLQKWLDRVKGQPWAKAFTDLSDPEQRTAFYGELKARMSDAVDKPATRRMAERFKQFTSKLRPGGKEEGKPNLERTALDLAFYDNMLQHLDPEKAQALTPTQKLELAGNLKTYMLSAFRSRKPMEGPVEPVERRGFEPRVPAQNLVKGQTLTVFPEAGYDAPDAARAAKPSVREGDRPTQPAQLPHELMDMFGDRLEGLFESSDKILRSKYAPEMRKVDYRKGVASARAERAGYQTKLEEIVQASLRDEYMDPSVRGTAVREVARWLSQTVNNPPDTREGWMGLDRKMQTFFGPKANEVLEAFDRERERLTRGYEHFVDEPEDAQEADRLSSKDVADRLAQNEQFNVSLEDESASEAAQDTQEVDESEVPEDSVYRDRRLGVPYEEMKEAPNVLRDLRTTYRERDVKFRVEPVLDADGKMTGKVTIHAEDAQASPEFSDEQWDNIRDKLGKSGTGFGVITVLRRTDKTDRKPWKVSLPNLTAETMRSIGQAGGGPRFLRDMVLRGLSNLMSDPNFTGFSEKSKTEVVSGTEGIKIPDDAIVAVHEGKTYRWGDLMSAGREEVRTKEREYWQGVVSHLNRLAAEFRARKKANPEYEDAPIEQYVDLRRAVEAGEPGAREAYSQFVKEWAQEREEFASGFMADERERSKGMIGINAIEDAFYRDRRLEQIRKTIRAREGEIKHNLTTKLADRIEALKAAQKRTPSDAIAKQIENLSRPEAVAEENRKLRRIIYRLKREESRLQQGFSSTLRENEIEQTARRGTEPEPRRFQEETGIPLVGPAAPKPRGKVEPSAVPADQPVTESEEKLSRKEKRLAKEGKGVFGPSSDELAEQRRASIDQQKGKPRDTGKFSLMKNDDAASLRRRFQGALAQEFKGFDEKTKERKVRELAAALEAEIGALDEALGAEASANDATDWVEVARGVIDALGEMTPAQQREMLGDAYGAVQSLLTGGPKPGKFSLTDNQGDKLFRSMLEMDGQQWRNYMSRVENSDNKEALGDALDFIWSDEFEAKMKGLSDEQWDRVYKRRDWLMNTAEERLAKLGEPDGRPGKRGLAEMRVGGKGISEEDKVAVREYVTRVLGPAAKTLFEAKLPQDAAGMFQKVGPEERVLISLRALDPRSVAFHETLHGLVARLQEDNPRVASLLQAAAGSPKIMAQLRKLLAGETRALEQLSDPEERLAYMYQFWAAGKLEMGQRAEGVFGKIREFLSTMLGAWSELSQDTRALPKAERILRAFHNGELADRSAAARVLDKLAPPPSEHWVSRWGDLASKVFFTADGYIRSFKNPAFNEIADKLLSPSEQQGVPSGMLQTKHIQRNRFMNRYVKAVEGLSDEELEKVRAELTSGGKDLSPVAREVRQLLKEVFDYMQESGVKIVEWNPHTKEYDELPIKYLENYFPRFFDREKIAGDMYNFVNVLREHLGIENREAAALAQKMIAPSKADPNESDWTAGLVYYAPNTMHRKLGVPDAALRPYLLDNMGAVMYRYINYTVRRAEYAKRFGNQGQEIALAAEKAKALGATEEQVRSFNQYVQAAEGSLGNDIDPKMRAFFGGVMTYQNLRLLPLALFSSLVDPMGIAVRGGQLSDAFSAFARGVRELVKDSPDEARELARTVGAINEASDEQMMADAYGSNFVKGWQRWMNKKLFQLNGMESWNNSMRIAATAAAERFIIRHVTRPGEHSERYLSELGLAKDDVRVDNDRLELTPVVVDAINKWVDGAVLRPHAGVRPIWMSDPKWMLISHLKQFTYSFHKTIVARAIHEAQHGNVAPVMAMASYVPLIVAADILRGLVTPGGADDSRLDKWGMADWMAHGVVRAGITGPGQYALDLGNALQRSRSAGDAAVGGIGAVAGPSVEQLLNVLRATAGSGDIAREALRAVPPVPALNLEKG